MEDMSLQLDVYEESSEHESDGENSGPENGSDRENLVKESWFLSPKRKWTLDEEVSEEPHGKRIRVSTVKPVLSGHSKRRLKLVFKPDYRLMLVKSIAECSQESILHTLNPHLSNRLSLRPVFCLFLCGRIRQVLLYDKSLFSFEEKSLLLTVF